MKPSAILAFTLCLTACGVARPVLESDNTKVEVKTVVRTVTDTAYIELPVIVEKVATLDTASVLENKYAKSEASVSGGVPASFPADKARQGAREGGKSGSRAGFPGVPGPGSDRHC